MDDRPLASGSDDPLTIAAIGALALIEATMVHEALGHGSVCLYDGGRAGLYPFSMQCTVQEPAMVAAGPLMNVLFGAVAWALLKRFPTAAIHTRYFLWLTMAYNLFEAAGYFGLGALTGFGDWGILLAGLGQPLRMGLALPAGLLYYGFMRVMAIAGRGFLGNGGTRGRRLTGIPYVTAGIIACAAAALTGLGGGYLLLAAAASFGAGIGLVGVHDWGRSDRSKPEPPVTRNWGWIGASAILSFLFVLVVGRGLKL